MYDVFWKIGIPVIDHLFSGPFVQCPLESELVVTEYPQMSCQSESNTMFLLYPLYTGGHFYCYMLDKSICHFRSIGSFFFSILFYL